MKDDGYQDKVEGAVHFLQKKTGFIPEIIIVLGTGLGGLAGRVEVEYRLPYNSIPGFPESTVLSHAGELLFGVLSGRKVAVLSGRFHYYEGYSLKEVTLPVRVLSLLGASFMVVGNASGGLDTSFESGTLMVIDDHLNFIPENPLRGKNIDEWGVRFPDLSKAYDHSLRELALSIAAELKLKKVRHGVYVAIPGPSLETPAETRYLRTCGADAVGMSTVPEVIVGIHGGLRILGVAMVSNVNDPDHFKPIMLDEILAEAKKAESEFIKLISTVVGRM
jgi:purine-nucleoside phosphorylase